MPTVTDELLQEMTRLIVQAIRPLKIILFGSYAQGKGGAHSDLDFLIVQDQPFSGDQSRRQQMAKLWRLFAHYPISQDFLIYSPEEVKHWGTTQNHVIAHALREGKVLYERN